MYCQQTHASCSEKKTNEWSKWEIWRGTCGSIGTTLSTIIVRKNLCCNFIRCKDMEVVDSILTIQEWICKYVYRYLISSNKKWVQEAYESPLYQWERRVYFYETQKLLWQKRYSNKIRNTIYPQKKQSS